MSTSRRECTSPKGLASVRGAYISDPSAAPKGKDSIVVLVPVGHLLPDAESLNTTKGDADNKVPSQDWDALVERARSQVIDTMEKRLGIAGLRSKIIWEGTNTPLTCGWCRAFRLRKG
jgi:phytoene desaturase (3,4-didehydrolycopene-forming)